MLLMSLSTVGALLSFVVWVKFITRVVTLRSRPSLRMGPVVAAVLGLIVMWVVLRNWADDEVRGEFEYLATLMALGFCVQTMVVFLAPWLGLSTVEDIQVNNNAGASAAFTGLVFGSSLIYAGANIGEGPSLWNNVFSAGLGLFGLFLGWAVAQGIGGISTHISEERDIAAGLRLAGLLVGISLIIGRSVAGDWESVSVTCRDFALQGWPILSLAVVAGAVERLLRPTPERLRPDWQTCGLVPGLIYAGIGVTYTIFLGDWSGEWVVG